jgi:hypothetical protein
VEQWRQLQSPALNWGERELKGKQVELQVAPVRQMMRVVRVGGQQPSVRGVKKVRLVGGGAREQRQDLKMSVLVAERTLLRHHEY